MNLVVEVQIVDAMTVVAIVIVCKQGLVTSKDHCVLYCTLVLWHVRH